MSIAIDPASGNAVMLYGGRTDAGPGIYLARFNGAADGGFKVESVNAGADYQDHVRLVVDSAGTPHALWHGSNSVLYELYYATVADGGYTTIQVEPGARVDFPRYDLAKAPDGTVHVAYTVTNAALLDGGAGQELVMRYGTISSSGIVLEDIERAPKSFSAGNFGMRMYLGFGPTSDPVVTYMVDEGDAGIRLTVATKHSGTWTFERPGDVTNSGWVHAAVNPYAAGTTRMLIAQPAARAGYNRFLQKTSTGWQELDLGTSDAGLDEFYPQGKFSPDGTLHIISVEYRGLTGLMERRIEPLPIMTSRLHNPNPGFNFGTNTQPNTYFGSDGRLHYAWVESDQNTPFPSRWWYSIRQ